MCAICGRTACDDGASFAFREIGSDRGAVAGSRHGGGPQDWWAVVAGDAWRLNGLTDVGTPVIVTYAFAAAHEVGRDEAVADAALREATRAAVDVAETVAGVRFVEVEPGAEAMIEVRYNTDGSGWSWAHYPRATASSPGTTGEISMSDVLQGFAPGSVGFEILLHELGHAMGLKHPHDGAPRLPGDLDNTSNTIMSYNVDGAYKQTYQALDVAALEYLYGGAEAFDGVRTFARGGEGTTVVAVGSGEADVLVGVNGASVLRGKGGDDVLTGRAAGDRLAGGTGRDVMDGGPGGDTLLGGRGDDRGAGGDGGDRVYGHGGDDVLAGGTGEDLLRGGGADDILDGGAGDDVLWGGRGDDEMHGGAGRDRFVLGRTGHDVATDFDPYGGDRIDLSQVDAAPGTIVERTVRSGDDIVVETAHGSLTLAGAGGLAIAEWYFVA